MKDFLILGLEDGIIETTLKKGNVEIQSIYKPRKNFIDKFLWEFYYRIKPYNFDRWFDFKNIDLASYSLIIIFRCQQPLEIIKYIRTYNKKCRIIYWLFDTIGSISSPIFYNINKKNRELIETRQIYNFEVWSFDKSDCKKYGIKYNNSFLFEIKNMLNTEIKYDCFFCGFNKGRVDNLRKLQTILDSINKTYNFLIVKPPTFLKKIKKRFIKISKNKINNDNGILFLENSIKYDEYLKNLYMSKCIIDIVQEQQTGMTLRAIESIFYRKKLITNFKYIKEYDLYNKNNIFIIGVDDIDKLKSFIDGEYEELDQNILNKYTINGWLKNFKNQV